MRPLGAPDRKRSEQTKMLTANQSDYTNRISGGTTSVSSGLGGETTGGEATDFTDFADGGRKGEDEGMNVNSGTQERTDRPAEMANHGWHG